MTQPDRTLTCPKCTGTMRPYERNGVTIDQCSECRGIYLDRGELERLIDAESGFYAQANPQQAPYADPYPAREGHHGDRRSGHDSGYDSSGYGRRRKRGGFLSELFD